MTDTLSGYTDADYLRLLAHWFDQMDKMERFGEKSQSKEVQETLLRIADKLESLSA